ncbi:MAG: hypothetical protein ABSC22_07280 [Roseiarcus sp.]|jgi:hypothetical protein
MERKIRGLEIGAEEQDYDEYGAPALAVAIATSEPTMTDQGLQDPAIACDVAMDYKIPPNARVETLALAQRCLVAYLAWLHDEALPRHPFWAKTEIYRAVKRLVQLQMAAEAAQPTLH